MLPAPKMLRILESVCDVGNDTSALLVCKHNEVDLRKPCLDISDVACFSFDLQVITLDIQLDRIQ